jgi:aminoglycoside adenylyltransferase-like protein
VADYDNVVREHAMQWPRWVCDMHTPGSQAYAVLTVCRALFSINHGGQASNLTAASYAAVELPQSANLISWALHWWCEAGTDADGDRSIDVRRFVDEVARRVAGTPTETRSAG